MDLRQLRYFVAVAEELHFGRAARRLHISQPPVSLAIRQLEEHVGGLLFDRNNKSVALTVAGVVLYQEACKLLRLAGEVEETAMRATRGLVGRVRVGFVGAMLFRGLMEAIKQFQKENPSIDITLHEMNTEEQIKAIEREQIDIGFIHSGNLDAEIQSRCIMIEPFLCCLPKSNPYAKESVIDLRVLAQESFILFPRTLSSHYHDRIVALCISEGFSPRIRHEVRHWLTIVRMVEEGMGIALVPAAMRGTSFKKVVYLPLLKNEIQSETLCIWGRGETSASIERCVSYLIGAIKAPA